MSAERTTVLVYAERSPMILVDRVLFETQQSALKTAQRQVRELEWQLLACARGES